MATLALLAVGAFSEGFWSATAAVNIAATLVVGAAAAVIDSSVIMPAIFGTGNAGISGQHWDDSGLQTASEGSPMHFIMGPLNKVGGTVIWISKVRVEEDEEGGGGFLSDLFGGGGGTTTTNLFCDLAIAIGEGSSGPIQKIDHIWANGKLIYKDNDIIQDEDHPVCDSIVQYTGSEAQTADTTMQTEIDAVEGSGSTPAYRGVAYLVINNLHITRFGNSTPQFQELVRAQTTEKVSDAAKELILRSGLDESYLDVTGVPDSVTLKGYVVSGVQPVASSLDPLTVAYGLYAQEADGKLKIFTKVNRDTVDVTTVDLGARTWTDKLSPSLELAQQQPTFNKPTNLFLSFVDKARSFQRGTVSSRPRHSSLGQVPATIDLPLTLEIAEAQKIARALLWKGAAEEYVATFRLPPRYVLLGESDLIVVEHLGVSYSARTQEVTMGANGIIEVRAIVEKELEDDNYPTPDDIPAPVDEVYIPPDMAVVIMDIPAVNDNQIDQMGFYIAAAMSDNTQEWRSARTYVSIDGGTNYYQAPGATFTKQSGVGIATSTLADAPSTTTWDTTSTLNVTMYNGVLVSKTDAEVTAGKNRLYVGGEVIGFVNATLTGPGQYTLDRFVRGDRDTPSTGHVSSESVAILDTRIRLILLNKRLRTVAIKVKVLSDGQELADVTAVTFTFAGNIGKTFPPQSPVFSRDGSNNLTITWDHWDRTMADAFVKPSDDEAWGWSIDFFSNSGYSTVVLTKATRDQVITFSSAEQVTAGLTPGATVYVRIYEKTQKFGRGSPLQTSG